MADNAAVSAAASRRRALALQARLSLPRRRRRTVYVGERVAEYRRYWSVAAHSIGAEFVDLTDRIWEVRRGGAMTRIANDLVALDDPVTLAVAGDKALCYRIATDLGIPVPPHRVVPVQDFAAAWRWIAADGRPFVVKPRRNTSSGIGVTVGVESRTGILLAFGRAGVRDRELIVERMVGGETYRLLFLGGEFIHAVRRSGIRITGDGTSSIRSLLNSTRFAAIADDRVTRLTLRAQGLDLSDVPPAGAVLVARALPPSETSTRELRTVYDDAITDLIGPPLAAELGAIVRAVGSEWAGIDIITPDPSRTLAESGGVFLEVNTTPGLHHHCGLESGAEPCRVAQLVLEYALARPSATVAG
jgi:cyanophycin synthetase